MTFVYCTIFAIIVCIIAPLFSFKRGKFLENFQLSFMGEFFTFWISWLLYGSHLLFMKKGYYFFLT